MPLGESIPVPEELGFSRRQLIGRGVILVGALMVPGSTAVACGETTEENMTPYISIQEREITRETDLLETGTWDYLAGARRVRHGLEVTPTGLAIVNKREHNRIDPNPPLNVYGTRLQAAGDFTVGADIESDTPVSLQLYGEVPLRFDDFRYERSRLECLLDGNTLTLNVWDGSSQAPAEAKKVQFAGSATDRRIQVRRSGEELHFAVNGQEMVTMSKAAIFRTGAVWLGVNSEAGPARVRHLTAEPLNGDKLSMVDTSTLQVTKPLRHGLQSLVRRSDFRIGAAGALNPMVSDEQYAQLFLGGEVGCVTTENGLKPQDVQPKEGVFTFAEADALVDLVHRQRGDIKIHGHTLMYDKAMPQWMQELPYETPADKQRWREVLEDHVRTVVGHFRGRVASWDVLNEVMSGFNDSVTLGTSNIYKALSEDCIDIAFRAAHEADPDAELYINDYGMETNPQGRGKYMMDLVKRARARGVPIHGVGFEGHVYQLPRDAIQPEKLRPLFQEFAALGVKVRISELDVTAANDPEIQAKQYADSLRVCYEARNCTGLGIWGLDDAHGSTAGLQSDGRLKPGSALPYTVDYQPKLAREAMATVLRNRRKA